MKYPKIGSNAKIAIGKNIVRKDYLLDEQVIIATARAKRPDDFKLIKDKKSSDEKCPFCTHNQDKIILIDQVKADNEFGWDHRAILNVFGAVNENASKISFSGQGLFQESSAFGHAEVIIESPYHEKELEDLSVTKIASLLKFLGKRVNQLQKKPGIKYVSLFKNRGTIAGASISHSHCQIISTNFLPSRAVDYLSAAYEYQARTGNCPYELIIKKELEGPRLVYEDKHVVVFAPFAPRFLFELWFFPKRKVPNLYSLTDTEFKELAKSLKKALNQLNKLGYPPYNMVFLNDREYGTFHFHIKLMPRLAKWAGFEYATHAPINPVSPEDAAKFYRKAWKKE